MTGSGLPRWWAMVLVSAPLPRLTGIRASAIDLTVQIVIFGPAATKWFGFLQRRIVLKNKTAEILARVAADQLLFAPVNLTVFLSSMAYMDGQDPKEKLMESWLAIYKANLCVWPIIQFINCESMNDPNPTHLHCTAFNQPLT